MSALSYINFPYILRTISEYLSYSIPLLPTILLLIQLFYGVLIFGKKKGSSLFLFLIF